MAACSPWPVGAISVPANFPVDAAAWRFETTAYGCPHIANAGVHPDLRFNVSHTHSLIVLAVERGGDVGVDVENVRARPVDVGIADHFFAPVEVAALSSVSAEERQFRFFEYRTFKESYLKARGRGLTIPLYHFSFYFPAIVMFAVQSTPLSRTIRIGGSSAQARTILSRCARSAFRRSRHGCL